MAEVRQSYGFPLSVASKSDVGRVRTNNEDAHGHAWLPDGALFVIVADGMGGHEAGEVASGLAVRVVEEVVSQDLDGDPRERIYNGFLEANDAILDEGRRSGTRGMGTTGIAGVLRGPEVHVGLIGDSRLYHIREGQVLWRTLDHTRVQMLIDDGEIGAEEARNHPEAGMLTRALGHSRMADGQALVPDVLAEPLRLERDDALVLSSDGLHDLVEDWEIAQYIAGRDADSACDALVTLACERGGHDNVTVTVVIAGSRSGAYNPDAQPQVDSALEEDFAEMPAEDEGTQFEEERPAPPMAAMVDVYSAPPARSNKWVAVAVIAIVLIGGIGMLALIGLSALLYSLG